MQFSPDTANAPEAPAEIAQRWIVHMTSGNATAQDKSEFESWLALSPENRAAFESEWKFWAQLEQYRERLTGDETPQAEIVSFPRKRRRTMAIAAAALAATIAVGVLSTNFFWAEWSSDYSVPIGERRTVALADGSVVTLNSGSAIAVTISERQRDIKLLKGEAYFEVKPDRERPFRVHAANGYAQAVGTAFSVHTRDSATDVVVTEGVVAVSAAAAAAEPILVHRGEKISFGGSQQTTKAAAIDTDAATAWRSGQLIIDAGSFHEAIDQLQRYWPGRIVILRKLESARRISLISSMSQIESQIESLAINHGYQVTRIGDRILILR